MQLDVRTYGDPVLREKARPFADVTDELRALAGDMLETMRAESGVGLAAQQIGRAEAICVVSVPADYDVDEEGNPLHPGLEMPLILINPDIVRRSDTSDKMDEGCLSFPGVSGSIVRSTEIEVHYLDAEGRPQQLVAKNFLARVIQHEVDHLNGILFIDRMSPVKRLALKPQLKKLKAETGKTLA